MERSSRHRRPPAGALALSSFLLLAALATGCVSTRHLSDAEGFYGMGQYHLAAQTVRAALPEEADKLDRPAHLLDNLYLGSAEFSSGNPGQAEHAFAHGLNAIDEQDGRAFRTGSAYEAKPYDAIMANTYRALSLWMEGETDRARVAFRRTAEAQEEASDRNARLIRRMQEQERARLAQATDQGSVDQAIRRTLRNDANAQTLALFQRDVEAWGAYDSFENPASHFLDAAFALVHEEGPSDLEHGSFASRKALAMAPSIPTKNLFELIEAVADGRVSRSRLDDVLIVVFENGLGPTLVERRFDLLVPVEDRYYYVGMALPELLRRQGAYPGLLLRDGETIIGSTREICDFNRIVTTSYKQALPRLIAAEVLRCATKVILQVVASEAARQEYGDDSALFVSLAGSLVAESTTHADTRMWKLLPDNFQASVSRKPASGVLTIASPGNGATIAQVALPRKGPAVVYVKIPAAGLPPLCKVLAPAGNMKQ